jgi:hypothetical protein
MVRGIKRVDQVSVLTMVTYNLTRIRTLEEIRQQATVEEEKVEKNRSKTLKTV